MPAPTSPPVRQDAEPISRPTSPKTIAYLDCPTGISGDMCLGAVIDAGVPLSYLQAQLATLGLGDEFTLSVAPTLRQGQRALKAKVELTSTLPVVIAAGPDHPAPGQTHGHHHDPAPESSSPQPSALSPGPSRNLGAIERLITQADLPERVCGWSLAVFRQLAEAEAAVHGIAVDQVHFHEVGATDAIVDIVGTCLGLDYLGIDSLVCSPLPTGQGRVKAAHGWLPVPAPAVLKLMAMRQVPIYSNGLRGELVTPTGAAIATALARRFGPPPPMVLNRVGLGAGGKTLPLPNILRLWVGTEEATSLDAPGPISHRISRLAAPPTEDMPDPTALPTLGLETVAVLETQVDDMVPQAVGYLYEQLLAAGALDVFTQPVAMKKSRPGLLITVICQPETESTCTDILFAETPTLGIRHQRQQRTALPRVLQSLTTPHGTVAMKLAYHPQTQALLNVHPEYEDCAALARRHGVPWQVVYQTALSTWYQTHPVEK
ncbi:MAG: nickel pincer cofactor biosynthesis protein LarC [Nodosilinea sp.]